MTARHFILLLLALLAAVQDGGARAQQVRLTSDSISIPLRPFIEVLEDPEATLSIDDIESPRVSERFQQAATHGEDLNFGYSPSAFWLRLTLAPEPGAADRWLLEISQPLLEQVTLFVRPAKAALNQESGIVQDSSARAFPHRNLVFPLHVLPGEQQRVYLRIVSSGHLRIPITLWTEEALHHNDQVAYSLLSAYVGVLLALASYKLLLYFAVRERSYRVYVAFVLSIVVTQLAALGLGAQFLWPNWPEWSRLAVPIGFCSTCFFGTRLTRLFLDTPMALPELDRLLQLLQVGFVTAALLAILGATQAADWAADLLSMAFAGTAIAAAASGATRRRPGVGLFLLAWALLLMSVCVATLRTMAWLPSNLLSLYAIPIGSAVHALFLSFALADRSYAVQRESEIAQDETLRAKEMAMQALQQSEKTLEQRVMQRTLELAETNERLKQSEADLRKLAHHDPLTGLANRALLFEELRRVIARAKRSGEMIALLMIDLDGFKPVNDTYGHAVGDQLLEAIATRLQECVRVSDTVARLGGDEFVVIVESVLDGRQALSIGSKIVATISHPVLIGQHNLQVGASVGVAMWPQDADDIHHLLQAADRAMYLAKEDGRGHCMLATPPERAQHALFNAKKRAP